MHMHAPTQRVEARVSSSARARVAPFYACRDEGGTFGMELHLTEGSMEEEVTTSSGEMRHASLGPWSGCSGNTIQSYA